ncbi:hypothetical protein [uncultured Rikenella sp.]|uniref:hypothetical protein n=1 Tax=uncultured Rikenella sp. TaxID=368003 RepID=UPI0026200174|nr:hypothetical protein [uncultured Rikenella sp.]
MENLIQKRTSLLNDFPVKALARGRALPRLKLPCAGGGRVTPAGRSDTTYRLICSAQFFDARLEKSCQNTQASFDDFPLLAAARG